MGAPARLLLACVLLPAAARAADADFEFFEKRIRPVFSERCFRCHGPNRQKANLRLDQLSTILKGGDSGPAIVPGDPEKSRLIRAIRYADVDLQMPPSGKLPETAIADLTAWVKMGAHWPPGDARADAPPGPAAAAFDLEARRRSHWAWKPPVRSEPPEVRDAAWPRTAVDRFILARLDREGLRPAPPADPETLVRRLYFDLTGLPPPAERLDELTGADSAAAFDELTDRLLASPQFGERWARHWLDLVRYAETLGHEFDYPIHQAWRYRDYVVRAFNSDVPYRDFVVEHVAGDLLETPRRHPQEDFNESVIGTAFYWLGQQTHSPVDVRQHQAEVVENQIDVLSKTFLGLTVACARCHDHKFDAISTRDYYALYGILGSSRYAQIGIDPSGRHAGPAHELTLKKDRLRRLTAERWSKVAASARLGPLLEDAALRGKAKEAAAPASSPDSKYRTFADLRGGQPDGWLAQGSLFAAAGALFELGDPQKPIKGLLSTWAHSAVLSRKLQGALRSPTFTIEERYLHLRASGRESRLNVVIDNFVVIRDPIYGGLRRRLDDDRPRWIAIDLGMWRGHRAYLELLDSSAPDFSEEGRSDGSAAAAWFALEQAVFSEESRPPPETGSPELLAALENGPTAAPEAADARCRKLLEEAIALFGAEKPLSLPPAQHHVLEAAIRAGLLDEGGPAPEEAALVEECRRIEASLPPYAFSPGIVDGTGLDERLFIRGDPRNPGEVVPRGYLEALAGRGQPPLGQGSGRRDLARQLVDPNDPLLARVMVNRVWQHLFGRGLVPTADNFGALGEPPSHPDLLDWLAVWYREDAGWSTKKLIRLLVTSSVYRQAASALDRAAEEKDPQGALLSRQSVRRLEGEAIRDAILAVSGSLDRRLYGPPVPMHLTSFMTGRGRPSQSGPEDGSGRRSLYLEVRRNFLSPLLVAFDAPIPQATMGRRSSSNLPAQALILLNDPFVRGEAARWSARVLRDGSRSPDERIAGMYREALGRYPQPDELHEARQFLEDQGAAHGAAQAAHAAPQAASTGDSRAWADLAHVLFNLKEFVFIR